MATETSFPSEIEIFRAGTHAADDGRAWTFSEADLKAIAAGYDPLSSEAPIVIGHPQTDAPAYGWVASVSFSDGRLTITARDVEPQFAQMVKARRFTKRSAAFYTPEHPNNPKPGQWYLRHVGFLGAQPPAIKGLRELHFADGGSTAVFAEDLPVHLSYPPHKEHSMPDETGAGKPPTQTPPAPPADANFAEADAARKAAKAAEAEADQLRAELAAMREQVLARSHADHVAFAETQIADGRLLPKDKDAFVAVMDSLHEASAVEFSEGDATKKVAPVEFIKRLVAQAPPAVTFGEFAPGKAPGKRAADMTDAELDAAARRVAAAKSISYADALTQVVTITQGD
jgi:hypothetical protein